MRREFDVYVDGRYIETILTGWTIRRFMAQLVRKYPDSDIDIFLREKLVAQESHKVN